MNGSVDARFNPHNTRLKLNSVKFKQGPGASWGVENPGKGYEDYRNQWGNLALLEKPIKIVAGNDFDVAKQAEYCKKETIRLTVQWP